MAKKRRKDKPSLFGRILGGIERAGNRLPHPITLFALFTLGIILVSALCALLGVSATGELINSKTLELETQTVTAVSLLSKEGVVYMLTSMVSNFTSFAPLGVVLVTMLGIGCAEGSGYLSALLKKMVSVTPRAIITPVVVLLGVMSNIATDIGYVVLIPVGALVFMAYGRHPLAGLAAAFAGVSGGFSANLLIGALDPLLAGISTEAAHIVDSGYTVLATDNWFFMIASTVLIVAIGTLVTDKIVEPRLGRFEQEEGQADHRLTALTGQEGAVITDTFDPILNITGVTFNGTAWTSPEDYTYDAATGAFATVAGKLTVPEAAFTQNADGSWTVTPGQSVLTVTGTV